MSHVQPDDGCRAPSQPQPENPGWTTPSFIRFACWLAGWHAVAVDGEIEDKINHDSLGSGPLLIRSATISPASQSGARQDANIRSRFFGCPNTPRRKRVQGVDAGTVHLGGCRSKAMRPSHCLPLCNGTPQKIPTFFMLVAGMSDGGRCWLLVEGSFGAHYWISQHCGNLGRRRRGFRFFLGGCPMCGSLVCRSRPCPPPRGGLSVYRVAKW